MAIVENNSPGQQVTNHEKKKPPQSMQHWSQWFQRLQKKHAHGTESYTCGLGFKSGKNGRKRHHGFKCCKTKEKTTMVSVTYCLSFKSNYNEKKVG